MFIKNMLIKKRSICVFSIIILLVFVIVFFNNYYDIIARNNEEEIFDLIDVKKTESNSNVIEEKNNKIDMNNDFFSEFKLERNMIRSKELEMLKKIVESNVNSLSQTSQDKYLEILSQKELELTIEKLIIAKGFDDAIVIFGNDYVNALIKAKRLSVEDVAKISDIITTNSGIPLDKLRIVEKE